MTGLTNIGIITQARMTSTRLPGKILKKVKNKTLLEYHIERLKETGFEISLATTVNAADDCLVEFAEEQNLNCHRGSETNVLSRFHEAALKFNFDVIVRVTSDCPLIDPHLIRNSIEKYLKFNNPDLYMSNALERTFARGFDFEIFSFKQLDDAFKNAKESGDLEHVTPYIWKNKSGKVELYHIRQTEDNGGLRITVDTPEDFELIRQLIEVHGADELPYTEIEKILRSDPKLIAINAHIEQKKA